MLIPSSTHTFTFPGSETLLLVWSGLWFISKSRDTQLGKVYFSGKVPTTGLASVTCLHISRQVQLFAICFSFLLCVLVLVMLHCDVTIFISQILLSRKASSQSSLLPPQGFRPEAKSRGGTLVARAYIKDSTYSTNMQSVYRKNLDLPEQGPRGIGR